MRGLNETTFGQSNNSSHSILEREYKNSTSVNSLIESRLKWVRRCKAPSGAKLVDELSSPNVNYRKRRQMYDIKERENKEEENDNRVISVRECENEFTKHNFSPPFPRFAPNTQSGWQTSLDTSTLVNVEDSNDSGLKSTNRTHPNKFSLSIGHETSGERSAINLFQPWEHP